MSMHHLVVRINPVFGNLFTPIPSSSKRYTLNEGVTHGTAIY